MRELEKKNIQTRIIYPYPIHQMKAYKKIFTNKRYLNAEIKSKGIFSLPLVPRIRS
jgi:dTDP-4-amino-4,6-dideoxygalactose transaminase